ncbi:MAG: hypothetical protein QNI90_17715 [Dinoroseobacter sp.]|nr:hypothetical protein [Dinoroseobacter sp.]MDJ0995419.1 hypothetical protein [Dinoroseobacter sp.]
MNKSILIGIVAVCVIGGVIFYTTRPEPTPQERLQDAAEQAGDAMRDATEAVGEAAQEASEAARAEIQRSAEELEASLTETVTNMVANVGAVSEETANAVTALIEEWRASGIVTPEGIDHDAAVAAVEASDLDVSIKERFVSLLEDLGEAPDVALAKLQELEAALAQ